MKVHNHDGFWNFKALVEDVLEEVTDIQDYSYDLNTTIKLLADIYDVLEEDFPKGIAYRDTENITIEWKKNPISQSMADVFLWCGWDMGVQFAYINEDKILCKVCNTTYKNLLGSLVETLKSLCQLKN